MTIEEAKEIIERKTSIPFDGETFEKIEKAYDIAIQALEKQIKIKEIIGSFQTDMYDDEIAELFFKIKELVD